MAVCYLVYVMMVANGGIVAAPGDQLLLQLFLAQLLMSQLLKLIPDARWFHGCTKS